MVDATGAVRPIRLVYLALHLVPFLFLNLLLIMDFIFLFRNALQA